MYFQRYYAPSRPAFSSIGLPRLRDLYLIILLTFLCHSVASGARVALSLYAINLGASALSVGMILGIYGILPMLSAVAAGRLSDRVGARYPMLIGAAGIAVGAIFPFLWPSLPGLYAASVFIGSGFMLYSVAMQNVAGHIGKPEDRATHLSLMALGFSFSLMIGPMLAGLAIDVVGHRNTFLIFAALPLFPVLALAFGMLRLPQVSRERASGAEHHVLDLLKDRTLLRIFVTMGLLSVAWELYTFMIPVYGSHIGLAPTAIGLIMGSFSAAILVIRFILPVFAKRLDALQVITAALMYAAALYVLFPLATSAWALAALSFLLGLGLGIPQPLVLVLLHNCAPAGRVGEAIGVRQASIYATQAFMPMIFGAVGTALGLGPVFWAGALCFAAGGLYGRRPRSSEDRGRQDRRG